MMDAKAAARAELVREKEAGLWMDEADGLTEPDFDADGFVDSAEVTEVTEVTQVAQIAEADGEKA